MVHWKYRVRLGTNLEITTHAEFRIAGLIRQLKTVDIYLLPNLSLAVLKTPTQPPVEDGLEASYLGRFNEDCFELVEQLAYAINEVCPEVKFEPAEKPEPAVIDISKITLKSVVTIDGETATMRDHAIRRGLEPQTVRVRLYTQPRTTIERALRPRWGNRRGVGFDGMHYGTGHGRWHRKGTTIDNWPVARQQTTCYDYSDMGEAA